MLIVAYPKVVSFLDMTCIACICELLARRYATESEDQVIIGRRDPLVVPLTAHYASQVIPTILLLHSEALISIHDTTSGGSFFEVSLSRSFIDFGEAHR